MSDIGKGGSYNIGSICGDGDGGATGGLAVVMLRPHLFSVVPSLNDARTRQSIIRCSGKRCSVLFVAMARTDKEDTITYDQVTHSHQLCVMCVMCVMCVCGVCVCACMFERASAQASQTATADELS